MIYLFAAFGLFSLIAFFAFWAWVLSAPVRPRLVYQPTESTLTVYDSDHPKYPHDFALYEVLESTVEKRRGDMDEVTPDRLEYLRKRIEEKKAQPLTLEIARR